MTRPESVHHIGPSWISPIALFWNQRDFFQITFLIVKERTSIISSACQSRGTNSVKPFTDVRFGSKYKARLENSMNIGIIPNFWGVDSQMSMVSTLRPNPLALLLYCFPAIFTNFRPKRRQLTRERCSSCCSQNRLVLPAIEAMKAS